MKPNYSTITWLTILTLAMFHRPLPAAPLGTAFSYQGRLNNGGQPANGTFDLKITLYDAPASGSIVAGPITNAATGVTNGLFTMTLDFGSVFDGTACWLEIGVCTNGGTSDFTLLVPRQALTPTPYARYAASSTTAGGFSGALGGDVSGTQGATVVTSVGSYPATAVASGAVTANAATSAHVPGTIVKRDGVGSFSANVVSGTFSGNGSGLTNVIAAAVAPGAVTSAGIATGQAVKNLNGLTDAVTLSAGSNVSFTTVGNAITVSASPGVQTAVPSGTIVLSQTLDNPVLAAAGFAAVEDPNWQLATSTAAWMARASFPAVAFNGRMWLMGGTFGSGKQTNDIWASSDGANWFPATDAAAWSARQGHAALAFGDRIWLMGGSAGTNRTNDVWCSQDGTNYVQAINAAAWPPRTLASAVVFNGQMWLLGGVNGSYTNRSNDIWSSADGTNWNLVTANAAWVGRAGHKTLAFNGRMWVLGGATSTGVLTNDVWSSADGTNWTLANSSAPWGIRVYHEAQVYAGQMWVLGGNGNVGSNFNDVWSSTDGTNWTQVTAAAAWCTRYTAASLVFNDRMWMMGGYHSVPPYTNDVWFNAAASLGSYQLFQKK